MRFPLLQALVIGCVFLFASKCNGPQQLVHADDVKKSSAVEEIKDHKSAIESANSFFRELRTALDAPISDPPNPVPAPPAPVPTPPGPVPSPVKAPQAIIKTDSADMTLPGDLIELDGSSSVGTGFNWKLIGSTKKYITFDGGSKLAFSTGTAGTYRFILVVANTLGETDIAECDVVIGTPAPPTPPPNPTPTNSGKFFVSVWYDSTQPAPESATVYNDPKLQSDLEAAGHQYYVYDVNSSHAAVYAGWLAEYKSKGGTLPALFIQDATTRQKITAAPVDESSVADVESFVASFKGK